jgi:hypothetical protein
VSAFDGRSREQIDRAREVDIETRRSADGPVHRTVIWIVVDDDGRVLVRSVRGTRGRWYRELVAYPHGAIHVAGRRVPVRAERAADAGRIEACSEGLGRKYPTARASLAAMLVDDVLETTLELTPD